MKKMIASIAALLVVVSATTLTAEVDLKGVKCVVAPKDATLDKTAKYKEGNVYFCCNGCAGKFAKDTKKFADKANHQLVATKQYVQKSCPISGRDVNPEISAKVAGTKVGFCCEGCSGKVEKAEDDAAKLAIVFNDKSFEKGFEKAKKETK
ncbi:hypothetical protein NHH03_23040 [Stieleria sp. TO1_6]|uniref:hypothetical protein n=1 Tax=Stieleria tagensis TaxID=2956795 RepID=UPI00209B7444|nr:hypothetical protein [Stieleria tagensis]MCO8124633.1 hypothetical protein [Stieleria tagensis]